MSADPVDDQIQAAAAHAERIVTAHTPPGVPPVVGPRGWVDQVADDFMAAYMANPLGCGHLENPRPVFGALQQMGVLRCTVCFAVYSHVEMGLVCVRCDTASGDVRQSTVTMGPIILVLSLCGLCRAATIAEQE